MRVIVSGGGTAGHISPTLAAVDALASLAEASGQTLTVLYVGQAGSMEAKIAAASGLDFAAIPAGKFRRVSGRPLIAQLFDPATFGPNFRDVWRAAAGLIAALRLIRRWRPDVVFVKGGYVGLPVGLAARLLRRPLINHESDLIPGLTNRTLGRWADRVAVGFPAKHYRSYFDLRRVVYTGNIVRDEILTGHRLAGLARFKLRDDLPVLLVTGGSQGARAINDLVVEALPQLTASLQVIHLTGEGEYERVRFNVKRLGPLAHAERYQPVAFLMNEMALAMAAADLVVARGGAQTIAELAAVSKPTILVPNYQAAGHQEANGRLLSRAGAALVLDERTLTAGQLAQVVLRLAGSPEDQANLGRALHRLSVPDAAERLGRLIWAAGQGDLRVADRGGE